MCYHAALRYSSVSTIMKFPGKRKSKHYFPVNARDPLLQQIQPEQETNASWVVGIDQTLVDIEAKVDDDFITRYGLSAGHSLVIEDEVAEKLYQELTRENLITHQFAGGTIGNTMHNYSVLADDRSVLLGVMCSNIEIGSYAYRYLCNTSSRTDLNYLQAVDGPIGRCFTLIGESGERTFAISPGHMNQLRAESIPEAVIAGASALVLTSYLVRCKPGEPMPDATMKAIEYAKKHNVPVVMTLGTKFVIADNPQMLLLLTPFQNKGKAQLEVKIGSVNGLLEGDRSKVRFVQTNMGRVILAAQIARTGADFGVMSGGGIRDSIEAGDITYKSVLKVQPFGNIVVYADMSGKEVVDYLTAVAQMKPDSGAYPQFANVSFVAKEGKLTELKIKGEPVDPAKTYRMATLSFNATGGDGYPRIDNKPGYVNTGFIDAEVLKEFIQQNSPLDAAAFTPKGEVSWL